MLFIKYDDKEIPYEGAWQNQEFVTFMEKLEEERWKRRERRWTKLTTYATVLSAFIAVCAAIVAGGSLYEAHQNRIADERPFVGVDIPGPQEWMGLHSTGKMPALHIEAVCFIDQDEEHADWNRVLHPLKTDQVFRYLALLPGQTDGIPCARSKFNGVNLVRYGIAKYEDFEGRQYQTPFCYSQYSHETPTEVKTEVHGCTGTYKHIPELK